MDFVIVATCHSYLVGKIFQESGIANHVVCINEDSEVLDEVIVTFTESFYETIYF